MKMLRIFAAGIFPNSPPNRAEKMRHKTGHNRQPINIITQINHFPLNLGGTAAAQSGTTALRQRLKGGAQWRLAGTRQAACGLKARNCAAAETAILRSCPICSIITG
jgi:hypothetical protein